MNMSQLQAAYDTISQENNVKAKTCSRKVIKKLIQAEVEGVQFYKPKSVNESERVSIEESRDVAIQLSETANEDCTSNMTQRWSYMPLMLPLMRLNSTTDSLSGQRCLRPCS